MAMTVAVAVIMIMIVGMRMAFGTVFVRVIELVDLHVAGHHEDAAVHAHHVDRRSI
jgi:hypothetical protein